MSTYVQAIGFYGAPIISGVEDFERWEVENTRLLKKLGLELQPLGAEGLERAVIIPDSKLVYNRDSSLSLTEFNTNVCVGSWYVKIEDFVAAVKPSIEIGTITWYLTINEY